jgi:hypothetical protein
MMLYKKYIQINAFLIIIVSGLISFPCHAKVNEDANQLFKQKKYKEALLIFNAQRIANPDDPGLCYFSGVCLTETNQYSKETIKLLLKATSNNQPYDVYYFLGKNYHALNDFKTAKSYYQLFGQKATKKEIKTYDLDTKIALCDRYVNPFPVVQSVQIQNEHGTGKPESENLGGGTSLMKTDNENTTADSLTIKELPLEIPYSLNEAIINFMITSEINYIRFFQFKTYRGKQNFINGWNCADTLHLLINETDSLRNEYAKTLSSELKSQVSTKVIELENQILKIKSQSDESYVKANESELNYWSHAKEDERWKLIAQNDSIRKAEELKHIAHDDSIRKAEELKQITENTPVAVVDTIQKSDSIVADTTTIQPADQVPEPLKTGQIIFKIQIGAYNTTLPESAKKLFKKISVLRKIDEYTDDRNYTVYTIGELNNIKDAIKLQDQIRQESVKDAFVIAIKDGKRIPLNEALDSKKK